MPLAARRLVPLALAGLALALPTAAEAKGLRSLSVCGAGGCHEVRGHDRLTALMRIGVMEAHPTLAASRPAPAPYYRVRVEMAHGDAQDAWTSAFIPSSGLWRAQEAGQGRWVGLPPAGAAALRRLARGLRPFPAPRFTAVRVGRRTAADPGFYSRLFTTGDDVGVESPGPRDWIPIVLRSERPGPWTEAGSRMLYSPSRGELVRDGVVVRLPDAVAERIGRDARGAGSGGSGGLGRGAWLGIAAAALAALVALALRGRRRWRPARRAPSAV